MNIYLYNFSTFIPDPIIFLNTFGDVGHSARPAGATDPVYAQLYGLHKEHLSAFTVIVFYLF